MKTNSDITFYHREYNKLTKTDTWVKHHIPKAMIQDSNGASQNKGLFQNNNAKLFVSHLTFNLYIGDLFIRGEGNEITQASDLDNYYTITEIKTCDYGSKNMTHIEISGQ